jgi:hypothetical protein
MVFQGFLRILQPLGPAQAVLLGLGLGFFGRSPRASRCGSGASGLPASPLLRCGRVCALTRAPYRPLAQKCLGAAPHLELGRSEDYIIYTSFGLHNLTVSLSAASDPQGGAD